MAAQEVLSLWSGCRYQLWTHRSNVAGWKSGRAELHVARYLCILGRTSDSGGSCIDDAGNEESEADTEAEAAASRLLIVSRA